MTEHLELERRFAAFKHAEAALMFQSGFTSNSGTVAAILAKDDVIVSDRLNHASIIDGARLSRAEIKVFEHADPDHADRLLTESAAPGRRQLLITDGVFSMDGDIAPLPDLVEVAERHGAIMMVDDAHASGVLGAGGAGTVDHFGLHGRVDIQVGTLSKAIGVIGGFIAGPRAPDRVAAEPRAPLPVLDARAAGGDGRLHRCARRPARRTRAARATVGEHRDVQGGPGAARVRHGDVADADHAGDHRRGRRHAARSRDRLFEEGVFCPAIVFPTVAKGSARVRTIVTADHTEADLPRRWRCSGALGRELGLV